MKRSITIAMALLAALSLASCEDFLTLEPENKLSPETYFKTEAELELWTNQFYLMLDGPEEDGLHCADDHISTSLNDVQKGTRTAASASWASAWDELRTINYFFEHAAGCTDIAAREKHEGVAHFFRALFYFKKVRQYGDVPYYDHVLQDTDVAELNRPRDSRSLVMKRVMEDFDAAYRLLPDTWDVYHLTKDAAAAFKARAALYEGTYRRYHTLPENRVPDETIEGETINAEWFLNQAVDAAQKVMLNASRYPLYTENTTGLGPYREFFILQDAYAGESILSIRYNATIKVRHGLQFSLRNGRHSATRRMVNHYLMSDGSKVQDQPNFETMTYYESFQNRDPRMSQTLLAPGYVQYGASDKSVETLTQSTTGYSIIKFVSNSNFENAGTSTTDWSAIRYPEVLLILAEAKAELGTLTQTDIDNTVNVIRKRVGMTAELDMEEANAHADELLSSYYPNVNPGKNKGVILEIRRERTVELFCEGQRQWDMFRWGEGAFLTPAGNKEGSVHGFEGVYFPRLGEYDMDNDGTPDILLYDTTAPESSVGVRYDVRKDITLSEGTSGYVLLYSLEDYVWDEKRDYLWPIPETQIQITNGALTQNYGY